MRLIAAELKEGFGKAFVPLANPGYLDCSTTIYTKMPIYTPPSDSQDEPQEMRLVYFSNEFPHDDLQDLLRRLYNLSKDKRHPVLARFINEATSAIRDEVRELSTSLRELIPPFKTVLDLADHPELRKGPLCGSIDGVLLCVVELATIIRYAILCHLSLTSMAYTCEGTTRILQTNSISTLGTHTSLVWA